MVQRSLNGEEYIYTGPEDMYLSPNRGIYDDNKLNSTCFYHQGNTEDKDKGVQEDSHNCGMIVASSIVKFVLEGESKPMRKDEISTNKMDLLRNKWIIFVKEMIEIAECITDHLPYGFEIMQKRKKFLFIEE